MIESIKYVIKSYIVLHSLFYYIISININAYIVIKEIII